MEDLFTDRAATCLTSIAIPGTHNSASAHMRRDAAWATGAQLNVPKLLRPLGRAAPFAWSRTQDRTVRQQLEEGVRFLDLRIAPSVAEQQTLYVVHGLVCAPLATVLEHIAAFARAHPREVVLIKRTLAFEFAKFHAEQASEARACVDAAFDSVLGQHMLRFTDAASLTFDSFWRARKSVAIVDEGRHVVSTWAKSATNRHAELAPKLRSALSATDCKPPAAFAELSAYLTPHVPDILKRTAAHLTRAHQLRATRRGTFERIGLLVEGWAREGLRDDVVSTDFFQASDIVSFAVRLNRQALGHA
jgi:hypothetical protein